MDPLNQIQGYDTKHLSPRRPITEMPTCQMVNPELLFVDHSYQRLVGEKGRRQIRKVIEEFCWTRFKPPICSYADHDGKRVLMVLDGQHTAIAAASNPFIDRIPVMVVDAPEQSAQAAAFVGQNTDRVSMTPLQLFQASIVAGDEEALTVEKVCSRAGVTILKSIPSEYQPRHTIAVTTIRSLVDRHTAMGARKILEVLAQADFAPITGHQIRAAEYLMTDREFRNRFEPEELSKAMSELFLTAEGRSKGLEPYASYHILEGTCDSLVSSHKKTPGTSAQRSVMPTDTAVAEQNQPSTAMLLLVHRAHNPLRTNL